MSRESIPISIDPRTFARNGICAANGEILGGGADGLELVFMSRAESPTVPLITLTKELAILGIGSLAMAVLNLGFREGDEFNEFVKLKVESIVDAVTEVREALFAEPDHGDEATENE